MRSVDILKKRTDEFKMELMRVKRREIELESTLYDLVNKIRQLETEVCTGCGKILHEGCLKDCVVAKAEELIPSGNTYTIDLKTLNVRPAILSLALAAEAKARLNDWKPGWKHYTPIQAFNLLKDEVRELEEALTAQGLTTEEYRAGILDEVADVTVTAVIVGDVCQALKFVSDANGNALPE